MSYKGAIYHGEVTDNRILRSISADVRKLCHNYFHTTWAYIVTWYGCRQRKGQLSNTFQLLLISSGSRSYVMIKFVEMEWPNPDGFNVFSSGYEFKIWGTVHDPSFHPKFRDGKIIFESKSVRNLTHGSNMNRPGHWFISFDDNCLV